MSELNSYYFNVTISGTALVYSKSREKAREFLEHAGVMVAGNKMREYGIVIHEQIEYNDEVSRKIWLGFGMPSEKINGSEGDLLGRPDKDRK